MNAPLLSKRPESQAEWLRIFAFFHLNLAFSSIEEERRPDVIARCYWPLLRLAEKYAGIGIEASGYTLEEIARLDPAWLAKARELIAKNQIEFIGSGYSQMIGPLVPARVTAENLRIGNQAYRELLGVQPSIALVNEQAFAAGLVGHYLDAGYRAILMDWDNPFSHHPEWDPELQFHPHHARGNDGRKIPVLWTNTAAFQQTQRFVHGDITREAYISFVKTRRASFGRVLCVYASDAEIFDFRPGRFRTEVKLPDYSEWSRLGEALTALAAEPGIALVAPSQIFDNVAEGAASLRLESAECPVPVKKQRKYNLARWAVTGRDNTAVNAACERIYRGMVERADADWKELCYLWASDFRTHLTDKRWDGFRARLEAAEGKYGSAPPPIPPLPLSAPAAERHLDIRAGNLRARLDRRRGLALDRLSFDGGTHSVVGGLPHGHFADISLQADWYTGNCVFQAPGEHKITDLEWCEANVEACKDGDVIAHAEIETPKGPIEKHIRFCASAGRIEFDIIFHWKDWGKGVLRLGHFTLLPDAFSLDRLCLSSTNGGGRESIFLDGSIVDHGAPVSFLVSSSYGFGMTDGWVELGDNKTTVRVEVDRCTAPLLGMLVHRPARRPDGSASLFCQLQLSAMEIDDTRNPSCYRSGPRRFRFSICST